VPLAQMEELHECVTLVCLFFAFGVGALYALLFAGLALLVLVVCLARRLCAARRSPAASRADGGKVKRA
jgi:hypothetical protein